MTTFVSVKYLQTDGVFRQLEDSDESGDTKSINKYGRQKSQQRTYCHSAE